MAVAGVLVLPPWLRDRRALAAARADNELRGERTSRLRSALADSGVALFEWDVAKDEVAFSPEWARILGGRARPLHSGAADLAAKLHPEDAADVRERTVRLLKGRTDLFDAEYRVRADGGEWRWVRSRARVLERDGAARALRVTGSTMDIQDRKERGRLHDEVIADIAHELGSPLASMIAAMQLVKETSGDTLGEQLRTLLDQTQERGERLSRLVHDMVELARIEDGSLRLHPERVQLAGFMRETIALAAEATRPYGTRIELDVSDDSLCAMADPKRLHQVLGHLLSNAAKFSARGALVRTAVRRADGHARISVADQGCGIGEELRSRIFVRIRRSAGARRPGTGCGLPISKALVERMGGRLWFESRPGSGSTFIVDLPAA